MKPQNRTPANRHKASPPREPRGKLKELIELLRSYGKIAIGFSGGVDSTFLAAVCARHLPPRDTLLIHLDTPLIGTPERASFERERDRFERAGLRVAVIEANPLADPLVASNPADRCYHCKLCGFGQLMRGAERLGFPTVLDGSNADDAGDYRPGMRAIQKLGVHSPLMETGWHKNEEREMLRRWGHEVWDLPAGACLATRIPCGTRLDLESLAIVRACEDHLHDLGLKQVRVRIDRGVAQVSADVDELELLARIGGRPMADSARTQGVPLPPAVADALLARGAIRVSPHARPYLHGETSRRDPDYVIAGRPQSERYRS